MADIISVKHKDQANCNAECKYYLENNNYDMNAAIKEFEDDLEFEKGVKEDAKAAKGKKKW